MERIEILGENREATGAADLLKLEPLTAQDRADLRDLEEELAHLLVEQEVEDLLEDTVTFCDDSILLGKRLRRRPLTLPTSQLGLPSIPETRLFADLPPLVPSRPDSLLFREHWADLYGTLDQVSYRYRPYLRYIWRHFMSGRCDMPYESRRTVEVLFFNLVHYNARYSRLVKNTQAAPEEKSWVWVNLRSIQELIVIVMSQNMQPDQRYQALQDLWISHGRTVPREIADLIEHEIDTFRQTDPTFWIATRDGIYWNETEYPLEEWPVELEALPPPFTTIW